MQFSTFQTPQEIAQLVTNPSPWVLIYKNSGFCTFSGQCYTTLQVIPFPGIAKLITVQEQRELSNYVTHYFNIPHSTPQVIILQHGVVKKVMNGLHEITKANIDLTLSS